MRIVSVWAKGAAVRPIQTDALAALSELGHEVTTFPTEALLDLARLRDEVRAIQPHFAFFVANLSVPLEVLDELGVPFATWFADNPFRVLDERFRGARMSLFSWDRAYLAELREHGIEHAHWLPLAANPGRFTAGPQDPERVAPLSFCADCGDDEQLSDLPFAEVPGLKEIVDELIDAQALDPTRRIPTLVRERASASQTHELLARALAGDAALARELEICVEASAGVRYRRNVLLALVTGGVPLDVYGPAGWGPQVGGLPRVRVLGWLENGEPLASLYRSSTVNLNLTIPQLRTALPMRVFDALAAGGAVLTDYRADVEELFDPRSELHVARSTPELVELAQWLLRHPRYAAEAARAGQARVLAEHTFRHRMEALVNQVCADHALSLPAAA
ncbi:MAG: glycosyltransferase [bacterium]